MKEIKGVLNPYFETGTEGVLWAVHEDNKQGYEGLHILEEGDILTIYDEKDNTVFDGKIEMDTKSGWKEHYKNAGHGQPTALGYWIHWTQKGFGPDIWAFLFFHGNTKDDMDQGKKPYRAKLIKKG